MEITPETPDKPTDDLVELARRLRQLHVFIREGEGDSDEADELRDEMDDFYHRLSPEEIERINELAIELNQTDGEPSSSSQP